MNEIFADLLLCIHLAEVVVGGILVVCSKQTCVIFLSQEQRSNESLAQHERRQRLLQTLVE